MSQNNPEVIDNKILLPHHEQQELCTTRLPYRQGRKLTAVKVYTINNESNHLLIFGVPSLNLRQETKTLFSKFGKVIIIEVTDQYQSERFTNTYHCIYDTIQRARVAKRMLDTKNFYGGSLHVTYAPELENIVETRTKLRERRKNVLARLRNIQADVDLPKAVEVQVETLDTVAKLNMGMHNTIIIEKPAKLNPVVIENEIIENDIVENEGYKMNVTENMLIRNNVRKEMNKNRRKNPLEVAEKKLKYSDKKHDNIQVVDFTDVNSETLTNIYEHLNYDKFGDEIIRKVPEKTVNKIKYNK